MFQERSYEGYWWIPEAEERKVPGKMHFNPEDGVELDLLTSIEKDPSNMGTDTDAVRYDRILGKSTDGTDITIINGVRSNASISYGGTQTESYIGNQLLIGHCFTDSIEFSGLEIKSEFIDAWAERSATGVEGSLLNKESEGPVKAEAGDTIAIKAEIPEVLEANLDDLVVKLKNDLSTNIDRRGGGEITDECFFEITTKEGTIDLEELSEYAKNIEDFISLALGKECQAEELVGIGTDEKTEIEILYPTRGTRPDAQIHPLKTNFILPNIAEDYESVLKKWFRLTEQLSQPINLYFSTRYNDRMLVNNEFFSLIQSIEVYHRLSVRFDGYYLDPDKYEEYKSELISTIDEDFENSFKQHLKNGTFEYANEYSLAKRLKAVIRDVDHILAELPWEFESRSRELVNARNDLTHTGDAGVSVNKLHEYTLILRALFETLLLVDLGIDEDLISERLGRRYTELS